MSALTRPARSLARVATLAAIAVVAGLCTVVPASADTGNYYGNGSLTAMSTGTVGTGIGAQLTGDMMVQRARDWVSHQVIYNQGKSFADAEVGGPYRTDDGGLVDMAWQLPSSPAVTTPSPGLDSAPYSMKLGSWSQLQPGDALAVAGKHISLFAGWTNQANGDFTYIAEENSSVPTAEYPANIHDPSIDGYPASSYELLRYTNPLPAIPANFNVTLSGFNPGQTVGATVHLTSTPTQSDVIGGLNYVISGPNGYYSEVPAGPGTNYPYALNTTQLANGSYTVSMIASETDGQNHTYQGASFTIANAGSSTLQLPNGAQQTFVIAANGHLMTKWQTAAGSGWTGWSDMGGAFQGVPAAVVNQGEISVFATGTDGNLYTSWQSSPGGVLTGFAGFGGGNLASSPAVVIGSGGGMQVFAIDSGGHLRTAWQTAVDSTWTGWSDMGGAFQGVPAAVVNQGEISVFATGTDGNLYTSWQSSPGGVLTGFAGFGGGNLASSPAVVIGSGGGMQVFAIDSGGHLRTAWQTAVDSTWTGWSDMGGTFQGTPAAVVNLQREISVFATGTDGNLYTSWQTSPGGVLTGFAGFGGGILIGTPNVVVVASGAMDAFAQDSSGNDYTSWQTAAGSPWTGWAAL